MFLGELGPQQRRQLLRALEGRRAAMPRAPRRSSGSTSPPGDRCRCPSRSPRRCARRRVPPAPSPPHPNTPARMTTAKLWEPSAQRIAAAQHHGVRAPHRGAPRRRACPTTPRSGAGRSTTREAFWREVWDDARRDRRARRAHAGRRRPHAGRALVPGREAQFRARTCSSAGAPTMRATRSCSGARTRSSAACPTRELHATVARVAAALAVARPARRRSRRGLHAQHARDHRRDAGRGRDAARSSRRARRTSACRACSTASARSSRACSSPSTATGTTASRCRSSTRWRRSSSGCRPSSAWWSCPYLQLRHRRGQRVPAAARRVDLGRVRRAVLPGPDRVRDAAVRPPALHPLLVGHHRRAEVHRARRRRHAAPAPQGAPAARRRAARRPAVLLHDLRLDDVELARCRARRRGRRCCCSTARRSPCAGACCGNSPTRSG